MEVVALKTFQDKYLFSEGVKDRFNREALAWVHLGRHPHIVQAKAVEELDNRLFIILEYIPPDEEGRNTLTHYLKNPISLRQALEWSIQFCYGMEYAASCGVTPHRDIKPDNIMITIDGTVKITDFGLAKLWDQKETAPDWNMSDNKSSSGLGPLQASDGKAVVGTPPWMAPEQFDGKADIRSDIYSFGVVLYQMVNRGKPPFVGINIKEYYQAHKNKPVQPLDTKLFPIIERCLKKSPKDRYCNFEELWIDFEKLYRAKYNETPPPPPEMTELEAWENYNKGLSFMTLGLIDDAILEFREALWKKPDLAEAYFSLGKILADKGSFGEAILALENSIKFAPLRHAQYVEQARQRIREITGRIR